MGKKIIDEFTGRDDLSSKEKWALRHPGKQSEYQREWRRKNPEKFNAICARNNKKWRERNPEKYREDYTERNRKVRVNRINRKLQAEKDSVLNAVGFVGASKRNEIIQLHSRGKSAVDIAMWTNCPMSAVAAVIANHQASGEINPTKG